MVTTDIINSLKQL